MGIKTKIDWCDSTCNPAMGCDGCELSGGHCYAEQLCKRHAGQAGWPKKFSRPELVSAEKRMAGALAWPDLTGTDRADKPWLNGMPRLVFLCDLADPFSESISADARTHWLTRASGEMLASRHVWLLLTKRPHIMRRYVRWWCEQHCENWPENIWLGTSVTRADTAWRIAELLQIHAAVRFVSLEPLLGPVDLDRLPAPEGCGPCLHYSALREHADDNSYYLPPTLLDWVIAGGESGASARPSHPDWFRGLRDQCAAAGVPFFFKQWGEYRPTGYPSLGRGQRCLRADGHEERTPSPDCTIMARAGKTANGWLLDGREQHDMPRLHG